jgi:hypothetical protein
VHAPSLQVPSAAAPQPRSQARPSLDGRAGRAAASAAFLAGSAASHAHVKVLFVLVRLGVNAGMGLFLLQPVITQKLIVVAP